MKDSLIQGIFPDPIYLSSINRAFYKPEINFTNKCKNNLYKNEGNYTSKVTYILNNAAYKKLKKDIEKHINIYVEKIICPQNNIKVYITQSWLNYTKEKEYHHTHVHPNSFISGVLYFDADINLDSIQFHKSQKYSMIKPVVKEFNFFNSDSWKFNVESGDIIMFPSYMTHNVDNKKGNNIRTSLAFNTFVKGILGGNKSLTELKLK
jgi:uncharacterized protein (TIGR02466 family)